MFSTLISADDLALRHTRPDWAIVDCRFDLAKPEWGMESYRAGHIPGAVYAHLDHDLSDPVTPQTGRHPLPDPEAFARRLEGWGIGSSTQVVAYDTTAGAYAARLWWLLRYLGHDAVAVLDGGWQAWQQTGLPVDTGLPQPPSMATRKFIPRPRPEMVASARQVDQMRRDPAYRLIDARAPERYRGEKEPIDPVAGHIPSAVNRFHGENVGPDGRMKHPGALREAFTTLLGSVLPENAVVYCGSGVTSAHHLLAMEAAGLPLGKLYAGSWSEWIRDPAREIRKAP